jgi:hypothetical protein
MFATADTRGVVIVWKVPKHKAPTKLLYPTESVSIPLTRPPAVGISPDTMVRQLQLMTKHCKRLSAHLDGFEQRLLVIAENNPWVDLSRGKP